MWTPDTPPVTREQVAAAVKAYCDQPIDPTLNVSPLVYRALSKPSPWSLSDADPIADMRRYLAEALADGQGDF